jgi:hypothetical protein
MTFATRLPPIPIQRRPRGPMVGAQRRKRLAIVAVLWCIGITPTVLELPLPWKSLGVGLIFPGAGGLYRGNVWLFLIVLSLTVIAIYRMWVMADHIATPALYLGAAVLAALLPGDTSWPWVAWAVPCVIVASLAIVETHQWTAYLPARRIGRERNAYLESRSARTDFAVGESNGPHVVESTEGATAGCRCCEPRARMPGITGHDSPMSPTPLFSSPRLSPTTTDLTWCSNPVTGPADTSCTSTTCGPVPITALPGPLRPASLPTWPERPPSPSTWRNGSR